MELPVDRGAHDPCSVIIHDDLITKLMRPIKSARDRTGSRGWEGVVTRIVDTIDDEIREEARNARRAAPSHIRVNESTLKTIRARQRDDTVEKYRRPLGLTAPCERRAVM